MFIIFFSTFFFLFYTTEQHAFTHWPLDNSYHASGKWLFFNGLKNSCVAHDQLCSLSYPGAKLIRIRNKEDQEDVEAALAQYEGNGFCDTYCVAGQLLHTWVNIFEGQHFEVINYTNWAPGEPKPKGSDDELLCSYVDQSGLWYSDKIYSKRCGLCENP